MCDHSFQFESLPGKSVLGVCETSDFVAVTDQVFEFKQVQILVETENFAKQLVCCILVHE